MESWKTRHEGFSAALVDREGGDMEDLSLAPAPGKGRSAERERLDALVRLYGLDEAEESEILDFALNEAIALTNSRIGYIYHYDEAERRFTLYSWSDEAMAACSVIEKQTVYDLDHTGVWGEAVRLRRPIVLNDFCAPCELKRGLPEGHVPLTRFLTLPVFEAGKIAAVVGVANKDAPYDEDDVALLDLFMKGVWTVIGRNESERALRISEERRRIVFEQAAEGILVFDEIGVIYDANPAAQNILGGDLETVLGLTLDDFWHSAAQKRFFLAQTQSSPLRVEAEFVRVGGERLAVEAAARPSLSGRRILTLRDITKRKAMEREILAGKERAEAADQAKSEFLANMSHEIRTPMNGVMGMLQVIASAELGEEEREYVALALESSRRLLTILNDILDLSRIESGRVEMIAEPFDPRRTPAAAVDVFREEARRKHIRLEYTVDAAVPSLVVGDEGRIRQILFNLVGNAVKFTDRGGVRVDVAWLPPKRARHPGRIYFQVSDDGPGIPEDKLDSVFAVFSQVDGKTSRKKGGVGLGLAIVKRLVTLMGGSLTVDSEPGGGAIFAFVLDAPRAADAMSPTARDARLLNRFSHNGKA